MLTGTAADVDGVRPFRLPGSSRLQVLLCSGCRVRSTLTASRNGKEPERFSVNIAGDGDSDSQLGGAGKKDTEKPVAVADSVRVR